MKENPYKVDLVWASKQELGDNFSLSYPMPVRSKTKTSTSVANGQQEQEHCAASQQVKGGMGELPQEVAREQLPQEVVAGVQLPQVVAGVQLPQIAVEVSGGEIIGAAATVCLPYSEQYQKVNS